MVGLCGGRDDVDEHYRDRDGEAAAPARGTIPALTAVPPSATRLTIISVDEHPASIRSSAAAGSVPPAEVEARYSEQAAGGARRTAPLARVSQTAVCDT